MNATCSYGVTVISNHYVSKTVYLTCKYKRDLHSTDHYLLHLLSAEPPQKKMDYATVAVEQKINFTPRKCYSYMHYHISCYMTHTEML